RVLDQIAKKPGAQALSFLVLRTLTQAVWDTVPIGHFGLASGDYLHFTSPIRRYPDLLVHRLLKFHLHREGHASGGGYAKPPPGGDVLAELARTSSAHERRAMEAEREAVAMYRAYLMRDQIGQRFGGRGSAVTSFGAFVEIAEPFVEGLIKLESLGNEPFTYDEVHMRLAGTKTGKSIELGDKVTVEINNVSVVRRRIDFTLIAGGATRAKPKISAEPRVGIAQRRKAGRELERVQRERLERAGPRSGHDPKASGATIDQPSGKLGKSGLRIGVSHRAMQERDAGKKRKKR